MSTRAQVDTIIDNENPDNISGSITPLNTRTSQKAINANSFNIESDDSDDVPESATKKWLTTAIQTILGAKTFSALATFSAGIVGSRLIVSETASFSVDATHLNRFVDLAITGAVTITINDATIGSFLVGDEVELFWATDSGSNTVTIAPIEDQTIISEGAKLDLFSVGSAAILKYRGSNSWALIAGLA